MNYYTYNVYANEEGRLNMKLVTSETVETMLYLTDYINSLNIRHIDWEEIEVTYSIDGESHFLQRIINSKSTRTWIFKSWLFNSRVYLTVANILNLLD